MDPLVTEEHDAKPRRKVILIVEEDFLRRWTAAEYLRETGFSVLEAVSAGEALSIIRASTPLDAVFCNVDTFLEVQGLEFLRCLEKQHPDLPVLFASPLSGLGGPLALRPTRGRIYSPYTMTDVERELRALIAAR
jgi:response regulator RpfG family c-di-GMP phosphodiesterase